MGLALGFFQQASGSEAAVYYSPQILSEVGVTSATHQSLVSHHRHLQRLVRCAMLTRTHLCMCIQGNIAVSTFKFAGELLAMFSMDRVGRKPLFITRSAL